MRAALATLAALLATPAGAEGYRVANVGTPPASCEPLATALEARVAQPTAVCPGFSLDPARTGRPARILDWAALGPAFAAAGYEEPAWEAREGEPPEDFWRTVFLETVIEVDCASSPNGCAALRERAEAMLASISMIRDALDGKAEGLDPARAAMLRVMRPYALKGHATAPVTLRDGTPVELHRAFKEPRCVGDEPPSMIHHHAARIDGTWQRDSETLLPPPSRGRLLVRDGVLYSLVTTVFAGSGPRGFGITLEPLNGPDRGKGACQIVLPTPASNR